MRLVRFVPLLAAPVALAACVPNDPPPPKSEERTSVSKPPALKGAGAARKERPLRRERTVETPPAQTTETPPSANDETTATPSPAAEPDPVLSEPFEDAFNRADLGPDWAKTSERWSIQRGQLCVQGVRNHPVWLKRRLPVNARIEFDATSKSPDGDIKAEFWGDGRSAARAVSYTDATSYLTIFGGWKNQFHVLARIDEHAKNRPEVRVDADSDDLRALPVEPNRRYRFKVERNDGKTVRWFVDDLEILTYADPQPLKGPGHEHFGFNDWDVPLCFDNLKITPLP